jgi:hypothetical protein
MRAAWYAASVALPVGSRIAEFCGVEEQTLAGAPEVTTHLLSRDHKYQQTMPTSVLDGALHIIAAYCSLL